MSAATMRRDTHIAPVSGPCIIDHGPRCWNCQRKLAVYAARPWQFICTRCKATTTSPDRSSEQVTSQPSR